MTACNCIIFHNHLAPPAHWIVLFICKHVIDRIRSIQSVLLFTLHYPILPPTLYPLFHCWSENHNYSHSPLIRNEFIVFAQFQSAVIICSSSISSATEGTEKNDRNEWQEQRRQRQFPVEFKTIGINNGMGKCRAESFPEINQFRDTGSWLKCYVRVRDKRQALFIAVRNKSATNYYS